MRRNCGRKTSKTLYKSEMQFTSNDTKQLLNLMKWRRDVRHFETTPVSEDDLQIMQTAMSLAPSVGNSRPWRVINVQSGKARSAVIDNFNCANMEAAKIYNDEKRKHYNSLKLAGLKEAPVHLAIFTDMSPAEGDGLGRQTMPETLTYSTISAIHQLWLAARSLNIGVGWVSILAPEQMNEVLKVDKDWKFTAYLCVGYPRENHETPELQRLGWQDNTDVKWMDR